MSAFNKLILASILSLVSASATALTLDQLKDGERLMVSGTFTADVYCYDRVAAQITLRQANVVFGDATSSLLESFKLKNVTVASSYQDGAVDFVRMTSDQLDPLCFIKIYARHIPFFMPRQQYPLDPQ